MTALGLLGNGGHVHSRMLPLDRADAAAPCTPGMRGLHHCICFRLCQLWRVLRCDAARHPFVLQFFSLEETASALWPCTPSSSTYVRLTGVIGL